MDELLEKVQADGAHVLRETCFCHAKAGKGGRQVAQWGVCKGGGLRGRLQKTEVNGHHKPEATEHLRLCPFQW
jgi:hypothetical protein